MSYSFFNEVFVSDSAWVLCFLQAALLLRLGIGFMGLQVAQRAQGSMARLGPRHAHPFPNS